MGLTKNILLWASANRWMKEHLPRYRFVRHAVTRFMPGETLQSALEAIVGLQKEGFSTVLTYLGENVTTLDEAKAVRDHYLAVLDAVHKGAHPTEISLKLTQLGLDLDPAPTRAYMEEILEAAQALGKFVWIDIESSSYVDRTVEIYSTLRKRYPHVGLCLQSYLYRTGDDVASLLPLHPSIRLVKGAYRESESVAYPKKEDVDRNYITLAERLMTELPSRIMKIGIATHDKSITGHIKTIARRLGISPDRFEFQMLYGIGRQAQRQLAQEGYHVRVLISYGSAWFPWYMRRLAERPANVWFVAKSLFVR
jgi:proline dehydrogenase